MTGFKRILILQTAFPGDIILTTPLFRNIKKLYPESRLTVVTTPQGKELLQGSSEIDSLITYDKKGRDKGLFKFLDFAKRLRNEKFDLALSPHLSFRTSCLINLSGSPVRIGYEEASCAFLYTDKVKRDMAKHEADRILSLLEPLHVDSAKLKKFPRLHISAESRRKVSKLLEKEGIVEEDTLVCIAPGSVWGTKRWLPEGYAELSDGLANRYGVRVMLIGSPAERESGDKILTLAQTGPVDMIGKTALSELGALISRCALLIGNDSAPGHVAAATGVPAVTIFGPTSPSFGYAPWGRKVEIVERELDCRPCHHHGPMVCPKEHFQCMRDISADEVMEAVDRLKVILPRKHGRMGARKKGF